MCGNDMQNRAQMKESKSAKDILKCANEKRRFPRTIMSMRIAVLQVFFVFDNVSVKLKSL